jgi:hypothetical protein
MAPRKPKTQTRFRSAETGRLVKPKIAEADPSRHIKDRMPVGKRGKGKK